MRCPLFAVTLVLVACDAPPVPESVDPPGIVEPGEADPLAAFMGTREEREARAPYSPEGWPLQRGDMVTYRELDDLHRQFGYWGRVREPFWLGETVFGAYWRAHYDRDNETMLEVYQGHFPGKTSGHWPPLDWSVIPPKEVSLPPHLEGRDWDELKEFLYSRWPDSIAPPRKLTDTWTREAWLDGFTGKADPVR